MALRMAVLKSVFNSYNDAFPLIFLFIAMIYFLVKAKKNYVELLMYEIFGILLLVTPFIGNKIVTLGAGKEANWPAYGILCVIPLTSYVMIDVVSGEKGRKGKLFMLFALMFTIQSGLGFSVTDEQFSTPGKDGKLFGIAIEVADVLGDSDDAYAMVPNELAGDIREYSDSIRVFYTESYSELQKDLTLLQREAEYYGCNYVVLNKENDMEKTMTDGGYSIRVCVGEYVIYGKNVDGNN